MSIYLQSDSILTIIEQFPDDYLGYTLIGHKRLMTTF